MPDIYQEMAIWDRPLRLLERVALALAYRRHMATPPIFRQYSNAYDMGVMLTEPERIWRGKILLHEAFDMTAHTLNRELLAKACTEPETAATLEDFVNEVIGEHAEERRKKNTFCAALDASAEPGDVYCMTAVKWARCDDVEAAALESLSRLRPPVPALN
jgi:hypothetical protein